MAAFASDLPLMKRYLAQHCDTIMMSSASEEWQLFVQNHLPDDRYQLLPDNPMVQACTNLTYVEAARRCEPVSQ